MRRIQCIGNGRPCPAWWYEPRHQGLARKRCPACEAKRRWVAFERQIHCSECGKLLIHPKSKGRPRVVCSYECEKKRSARLRRLARRFA